MIGRRGHQTTGRTLGAAAETLRVVANGAAWDHSKASAKLVQRGDTTVISPELVLVDPELRASLTAEFRAAASYDLPVLEWTNPHKDSDLVAVCASSDSYEEVSSGQGQAPLVIAALIYAAASLAEILFFGILAGVAIALVITTLVWIG
jgi:hypothetical protein